MLIIIEFLNRNSGIEERGARRGARVTRDARYRCGSDAAGFAAFTIDISMEKDVNNVMWEQLKLGVK
jgi:hypothetical protein